MKRNRLFLTIVLLLPILCGTSVSQAQNLTPDWIKHGYGLISTTSTNNVIDMVNDKHGNIYVLSANYGTINIDGHTAAPDSSGRYSLTSWDCDGSFRWMKTIRLATVNDVGFISGLAVDTLEGIYFSGKIYVHDSLFFDSDTVLTQPMTALFMVKYNSAGAFQWLQLPQINPASSNDSSQSLGLSVNQSGNLFWVTYLNPGSYANGGLMLTANQYGVLSYSASGAFQSFTPLSMSSGRASINGYFHFKRNPISGKMYVAGGFDATTMGSLTFGTTSISFTTNQAHPAYVAAFTNTGSNLWVKQSSANKSCAMVGPDIDGEGNLYVLGYADTGSVFNGDTAVNSHAANMYIGMPFVMAMDSNGNELWVSHAAPKRFVYIDQIKYKNNRVVVAGEYQDSLWWDNQILPRPANYSTNIFLTHLDAASGNVIEMDSLNRTQYCGIPVIALDKNSNLYLGGSFDNSLSFGSNTLSVVSNYYDWFIAKYKNVACNCNLLQPEFSLSSSPGGQSYSVSYNGDTPYTSIAWNFGDGTMASGMANPSHTYTAIGNYPVCVTVVNGCGSNSICHWVNISTTGINDVPSQQDVSVYPNPGSEEINIINATAGMILDLYNLQGQKLGRYTLKGANNHLNIKSLTPGVYLLRFTDNNGTQHTTRLMKQ
jgi:hypothetical protein